MSDRACPTCGYVMNPLETTCPRCAQGIVPAVGVACPGCGQNNSTKRFACAKCWSRLPVPLDNIEKRPLKEYQRRATEAGNSGYVYQAIALLEEACEFYPEDAASRQVLIELHHRAGNAQAAQRHQYYLFHAQMRQSEQFCAQQADDAFGRANFPLAVELFSHGVNYHPQSIFLHEGLAAALDATGDTARAHTERAIAQRLRYHAHNAAIAQQQHRDQRAHSLETAGAVAGTAIGATGAAAGAGITIVSLLTGVFVILVGLVICTLGVAFFLTCIGIIPGIVILGAGATVISGGFAIIVGGTAAGAGTGMLGIFTGALTSGTALLHRVSRRNRP